MLPERRDIFTAVRQLREERERRADVRRATAGLDVLHLQARAAYVRVGAWHWLRDRQGLEVPLEWVRVSESGPYGDKPYFNLAIDLPSGGCVTCDMHLFVDFEQGTIEAKHVYNKRYPWYARPGNGQSYGYNALVEALDYALPPEPQAPPIIEPGEAEHYQAEHTEALISAQYDALWNLGTAGDALLKAPPGLPRVSAVAELKAALDKAAELCDWRVVGVEDDTRAGDDEELPDADENIGDDDDPGNCLDLLA